LKRGGIKRLVNIIKSQKDLRFSSPNAAHPHTVTIETTRMCNLKCRMCPLRTLPRGNKFVEPRLVKRVCSELHPYLDKIIFLGLGEPLMHPRFFELLEIANSYNVRTEFTTNGTLVTEKVARKLIDHKVYKVNFSVDGATKKTFESMRNGADFTQVLSNIRRLSRMENAPILEFEFVCKKENIDELPEVVEMAGMMGVDAVRTLYPMTFSKKDSIDNIDILKLSDIFDKATDVSKRNGVDVYLKPLTPCPMKCVELWSRPYITIEGNVRPCCFIGMFYAKTSLFYRGIDTRIYPDGYNMSNIYDKPFSEIWNSQKYQTLRKAVAEYHSKQNNQEWTIHDYKELLKGNADYCEICHFRFNTMC